MIESFSKAKRYMLNVVLNLLLAEGMLLIYVMRQSNKMYDMSRIVQVENNYIYLYIKYLCKKKSQQK